jgi:hypothetical protein
MKSLLIALSLFSSFAASAASFPIPAGYKAILDCPALNRAPDLMVAVRGNKYFLAAKVSNQVKLFLMENIDADMGYVGYAPVANIGALAKYLDAVYVMNNEEDIEDMAKAIVTRGQVHIEGKGAVRECLVLTKFYINK